MEKETGKGGGEGGGEEEGGCGKVVGLGEVVDPCGLVLRHCAAEGETGS